ncbi:MAG: beta-lactamase family protein [Clostridiales bacterium]|nr:beta-lactamase family protein [Clostridiales bacterium]
MKKFVSVILTSAMAISFAGCTSQPEETVTEPAATTESVTEDTSAATGKEDPSYTLQDIKLTESERSWSNPEDKYSEILDLYGDLTTTGTLVIATDDDILYLYAENQVEKDGKTLESQDTVYDMASVSKTVTAVALLQLAEQGKVSLDDTLDKFFPEYETGKRITVDNLLHMSSGIPDYCNNPDPFWNISGEDAANQKLSDIFLDKISDEEFLQAMYKAPLGF